MFILVFPSQTSTAATHLSLIKLEIRLCHIIAWQCFSALSKDLYSHSPLDPWTDTHIHKPLPYKALPVATSNVRFSVFLHFHISRQGSGWTWNLQIRGWMLYQCTNAIKLCSKSLQKPRQADTFPIHKYEHSAR